MRSLLSSLLILALFLLSFSVITKETQPSVKTGRLEVSKSFFHSAQNLRKPPSRSLPAFVALLPSSLVFSLSVKQFFKKNIASSRLYSKSPLQYNEVLRI